MSEFAVAPDKVLATMQDAKPDLEQSPIKEHDMSYDFPTTRTISLDDLDVPGWQRPLDPSRVEHFVKHFDPARVRRPLIAPGDQVGRFNIVDGQHTVATLKAMGITEYACDFVDLPPHEQPTRFADQHDGERKVNSLDQFFARTQGFELGGDTDPENVRAHEIKEAIETAGWIIQRDVRAGNGKQRPFTVQPKSMSGIGKVYDQAQKKQGDGQAALTGVLKAIATVWPLDSRANESAFIVAIGLLLETYEPWSAEQQGVLAAHSIQNIYDAAVAASKRVRTNRSSYGSGDVKNVGFALADYIRRDLLKVRPRGAFRITK